TLVNVANGLRENAREDESREVFALPPYLQKMEDNKWFGEKSGQGFYKKTKDDSGTTEILALDLKSLEYRKQEKAKSSTIDAAKSVEDLRKRMKVFEEGSDKAGRLFRAAHYPLFEYVSRRIPEISNELYRIDDA